MEIQHVPNCQNNLEKKKKKRERERENKVGSIMYLSSDYITKL